MFLFEFLISEAVALIPGRIVEILSAIPLDVKQGGTASAKKPNSDTCFAKLSAVSRIVFIRPPR